MGHDRTEAEVAAESIDVTIQRIEDVVNVRLHADDVRDISNILAPSIRANRQREIVDQLRQNRVFVSKSQELMVPWSFIVREFGSILDQFVDMERIVTQTQEGSTP